LAEDMVQWWFTACNLCK